MLKHVMRVGTGERRGLTKGMHCFNALFGCTFTILALLHVPHPTPWLWVPYFAGAVLAFLTLTPNLSVFASRILAIVATGLMFYLFAGFFMDVPKLASDWYQSQEGWLAVAQLLGAFTLIPVLSAYSCRCKAEREQHQPARREGRHHGFFTVPDQVPPRSS